MTTTRIFSAAELQSYVNDTASLELRTLIENAANSDATLAEKIASLDPWADVVSTAIKAVPLQHETEQMSHAYAEAASAHASAQAKSMFLKALVPAGVVTALAAGLLGAYVMQMRTADAPPPQVIEQPQQKPAEKVPAGEAPKQDLVAEAKPTWLNAVADYVRLMTPKTFAVTPSPATLQSQLAAVDADLGIETEALLAGVPELKLQRAEILQLNGRPLAQLAFLDANNTVIAICVLSRKARPEGLAENTVSALKETELQGLNIVSWDLNTHGYLVIGKSSPQTLKAMAEKLSKRI